MEKPYFLLYKVPIDEVKKEDASFSKCLITCVFQTKLSLEDDRFCMALVGSIPQLGYWNRVKQTIATYRNNGVWQATVNLPVNIDIQYKWVVYEKQFCRIVEYEPGKNRRLRIVDASLFVEDFYNGVQVVKEISPGDVNFLVKVITAAKQRERSHRAAMRAYNSSEYLTKKPVVLKGVAAESEVFTVKALGGTGRATGHSNTTATEASVMQCRSRDMDGGLIILDEVESRRKTSFENGGDATDEGSSLLDSVKKMINENAEDIMKVGMITGAVVSMMMLCKKLF